MLLDFSNAIDIVIFSHLSCVFKAPSIYYQLFTHLFLQCHKIVIEASVTKVSLLLQCLVIAVHFFFFFFFVIFNNEHCYIPFLHTILVWFGFFGAGSASSLCWQFSLNVEFAIMALLYVSESFSKFGCFISHKYVPNKRVLV